MSANPGTLRRLVGLVAPYRGRMALFIVSSLLVGGVGAGILSLLRELVQFLIDRTPPEKLAEWMPADWFADPYRVLWFVIAAGIALLVVQGVGQFLQRYMEGWLNARVILDTQERVARRMLTLHFRFFQVFRHGELISRFTNDMNALSRGVRICCIACTRPFQVACIAGWVVLIDWRLALLGFVALPLGGALAGQVGRRLRRASRHAQRKLADLANVMVQFLGGMRIVKAYGCERFEADLFRRENRDLFGVSIQRERARALERPLGEFMTITGALAVLAVGGRWVLNGTLDASTLQTFFVALVMMYLPVKELARMYNDYQEAAPGAERVFAILDHPNEMAEGDRDQPPPDWSVRFENVDFSHIPDAPVLRGLFFEIPVGGTLALVGRTGCGKSTTADLLLRLYDPDAGRVTLGGVDARDFTFRALRAGMALVSQDAFLFNGTIRANIAYGMPEADQARVEAAARAAQIHDDIMLLPQGYDAPVGERGASLSGGQRQRVALARALFKDAPILILDEATSALDAESERKVQKAVEELLNRPDRTCLVIAHRLSTVRRADRIAVLDGGRIAASGTHEELLRLSPVYAGWVALQGE